MSDFDTELFTKVVQLEARLEVTEKKLYEATIALEKMQHLVDQVLYKINPTSYKRYSTWE